MKKLLSLLAISVISLLIISGCASKNIVKKGDIVSITYTATFSDGQLFDKNTENIPLIFTVGSGQTIQGLDDGVVGAKVGSKKTITISPDMGYGKLYNPNNIQKISQLIFDKLSIKPENGTTQKLGSIEGIVKGAEKDQSGNVLVLFDINPRQTRDTITYNITILDKK